MKAQDVNSRPSGPPEVVQFPKKKSIFEKFREKFAGDRRFRRAVIAGLLLAAVLMLRFLIDAFIYESTDDAFIEGHVIPVSSKIPAHVVRVGIDDNEKVHAGQLLVELDARDYRVRYEMAKADFEAARAEARQARTDFERYKALKASGEISYQQMDQAVLHEKTAAAKEAAARAKLKQAKLQVSYTKIASPVDGIVTRKSVEPGTYVQPGEPLMAVVPPEKWVIANFKETQIARMRPGQSVEISIDTYKHKTFKAHVDSLQRGTGARFSLLPPENATGNFVKVVQRVPVKIVFDEAPGPDDPLALGMSVVPKVKVRGK